MDSEKRGKADENADSKSDSNMPRMAVQRKDLPDTFPPFILIEHVDLPNRCEV